MDLAMQGAIWLGAGVTLVMLLSRRRRRRDSTLMFHAGMAGAKRAVRELSPATIFQCRSNLW